jgi:hypothetical protein
MKSIVNTITIVMLVNLFLCFDICANNLIISDQRADKGEDIFFEISINSALNDVKSFGFQIEYPADRLEFDPDNYEIGPLLSQGQGYLTVGEDDQGMIRVGWFCMLNYKIPKHANGVLLKLKFTTLSCKKAELKFVSVYDHFADWPIKNGNFSIIENSFCRLDFNGDSRIGLPEVIELMRYLSDDQF